MILGFFWASFHANLHLRHRLPSEIENKPIEVCGTILSIPEGTEHKSFDFKPDANKLRHLWKNPGIVRLHLTHSPFNLQVGDTISCVVKLKKPHGNANPGSFDKEKYLFLNRISAEGVIVSKNEIKKMEPVTKGHENKKMELVTKQNNLHIRNSIAIKIHQIRSKIADNIKDQLQKKYFDLPLFPANPHRESYHGIITALVVGLREGITSDQWQVFRQTGTAHLIAISGLHVGLVSGLFFTLTCLVFRLIPSACLKVPAQIVAAWVAILSAICYALLAGLTLPTQRAVIMVIIFMLALFLRRQKEIWQSYFIALGIVLVFEPLSFLSEGFWLSFSAVAVILYGMRNRIAPKGLWWKWARTQWVVFLGLAPVSLALFQQCAWISPFSNLFAIPWMSLTVVPFALLGSLLGFISHTLGGFFLTLANVCLDTLWPCLEKCAAYSLKISWNYVPGSPAILGLSMLGIILLLTPKGFPSRKLGGIFLLPLILHSPKMLEPDELRFTLLDVGQGLSAVIETRNHTLVFDTGSKLSDNYDMGSSVVLPFLKTRGKSKIDSIIISHLDNDHVGGLQSIFEEMPTKKILSSEPEKIQSHTHRLKDQTLSISACSDSEKWNWDGIEFEILNPLFDLDLRDRKKRNNHSCVLKIKRGEETILLTGDIEASVEQKMLKQISEKLASTILIVPHHGSKTSSTKEFIQAVNPRYALIPVGYHNSYGHPNPEVLARYKSQDSMILNTVDHGAISFEFNSITSKESSYPKAECYRNSQAKFWRSRN